MFKRIIDAQVAHLSGKTRYDVWGRKNEFVSEAEIKILSKIKKINQLGLLTYVGQSGQINENLTLLSEIEYYAFELLDKYLVDSSSLDMKDGESYDDLRDRFQVLVDDMLSHVTKVSIAERYYLYGICRTDLAQGLFRELNDPSQGSVVYMIRTNDPTSRGGRSISDLTRVVFYFDNREKIMGNSSGFAFGKELMEELEPTASLLKNDKRNSYSVICICATKFGVNLTDRVIKALMKVKKQKHKKLLMTFKKPLKPLN